jgi:hypothetical protein
MEAAEKEGSDGKVRVRKRKTALEWISTELYMSLNSFQITS